MRTLKNSLLFLLVLFFAGTGLCQTERALSVEVNRLSDRVAVFKIEGGNANVVALNSQAGLVVIDTDVSPTFAALLRQKMANVFGRTDFAYVINTHSHGDHSYGNQVFTDAVIIGHENVPDEMTESSDRLKGTAASLKAGLVRMKESLEKMEKGSDKASAVARRITYYEALLQGYENNFVLTSPSITFGEGLTLHLGDIDLNLMFFGTSHSASDILIRCPQEGLWMTGDLFSPGQDLYIDSERIPGLPRWAAHLEKMVQTEKDTKFIVPGHGALLTSEELKKSLAYVRAKQGEFAGKESAFFAFRKAFEKEGPEISLRVLKDLKAKPDKYYTLHPEIDQFAYRLMLQGKLDEALSIFLVLAELFPDSYLAFDSLGEVYLRKGDREKAGQSFKKSLELNPNNQNAVQQLKSLQEKK